MIDDREIWRAAQNMIDRYGERALTQINIRIRELERQGDPDARSAWLRIRAAARTLMDASDDDTKH